MYWKFSSPDILNDYETYCQAVKHGSRVSHRVLLRDAFRILPHRQLQGPPPPYFPLNRTTPPGVYIFKSPETEHIALLNSKYICEVQKLLQQENARAFLEHGGLIWRLALEFGGLTLWNDLFLGPSVFCVDAHCGERAPDANWIADTPSQAELDLLLGVIYKPDGNMYAKSLFPPYSTFHESPHWMGAWTTDNEEWFQGLLERLRAGELKPQPKLHWRTSTGRSNKKTITESVAQSFLSKLDVSN
jgi:hypothetical protein